MDLEISRVLWLLFSFHYTGWVRKNVSTEWTSFVTTLIGIPWYTYVLYKTMTPVLYTNYPEWIRYNRWCFQTSLLSPLGNISVLPNIFQRGRTHQLEWYVFSRDRCFLPFSLKTGQRVYGPTLLGIHLICVLFCDVFVCEIRNVLVKSKFPSSKLLLRFGLLARFFVVLG